MSFLSIYRYTCIHTCLRVNLSDPSCRYSASKMATDIGSPQRFFHMPRFQHQAPRQVFYKRPDFAQQQAMQQLTFDGKRMRKAVNRKTIDYNPSVIKHLGVTTSGWWSSSAVPAWGQYNRTNMFLSVHPQNRLWQRDHRDFRAIQPDAGCYNDVSVS